jgi:hypothetical protein
MDSRALIVTLVVAACAGPRPEARVISVAPSPQAGDQRVTVDLTNHSGGEGEVELRVVLRGNGIEVAAEQNVEMDGHQHLVVEVDIPAPAGTYTASATAQFPD